MARRKITEQDRVNIIQKEKLGLSIRKTAKELEVPNSWVEKIFKGIRKPKKLIDLNEDYFKTINTEDKAYWLGFLYADGYVKQRTEGKFDFELTLKNSDFEHLNKFKKSIDYGGEIKDKKINLNGKEYFAKRLFISRAKFCKNLINNGCVENKTFKLSKPELENHLVRHFVRGFFDGDGHITKDEKYCGITGYTKFLSDIYDLLSEYIDVPKLIYNDNRTENVSELRFNNSNCVKFLNYIYMDCNLYLDRKYEQYKKLIGK